LVEANTIFHKLNQTVEDELRHIRLTNHCRFVCIPSNSS
jgi:hypothetical protein